MELFTRGSLRHFLTEIEARAPLPVLQSRLWRPRSQILKKYSTTSATAGNGSQGALEGVRILDLSRVLAVRLELTSELPYDALKYSNKIDRKA
jgi:hypothetical protein